MENAVKTRSVLLGAALAFCAALAAHAPSLSDAFLWDDAAMVEGNSFLASCASLPAALNPVNLFKVLPVPMSARPAVNASIIADACAKAGPRGMRLTNLLLHAANAVLVLLLALTLSGSLPAAAAAAVLFGVHPAAGEAVNIVVFRSHLLGLFFFFCSLLAAVFHARRPAALSAAAAGLCALLGMLSVETAAVIPAAAAAAVYFDSGTAGLRRAARLFAALLLVLAFYAWFRAPRSGYDIPGVSSPGITATSRLYPASLFTGEKPARAPAPPPQWREVYSSPAANFYTMASVAAGYALDAVSPSRLSPDYGPEVITGFGKAALPLLFCLCFLAAAAGLLYLRRLSGLGMALFLITLLPALNLVPLYNLKADRYLYFPLAGLALTAASLIAVMTAKRAYWALVAAAALLFSDATLRRAPVFRDDTALFSEAVKRAPTSARARTNLSAALLRSGDPGGAVQRAREASALDPGNAALRLRLAYTLTACGRGREALPEAKAVLAAGNNSAQALYLAGLLTLERDRAAGAALLERALKADPSLEEAALTLAMLDKRTARRLPPGERNRMTGLEFFYRSIGLLF